MHSDHWPDLSGVEVDKSTLSETTRGIVSYCHDLLLLSYNLGVFLVILYE